MDKIKSYCGNINIIYNENFYPINNYISDEYDFTRMNSMNALHFGSFNMIPDWDINSYNRENKYTFPFYQSGRATLEIEVADDNFEYVKEKLYSNGAITVI